MEFNEDAYWENRREEYEGANRKAVEQCKSCRCNLYAGDGCYRIDDEYYCEDCVMHDTIDEYEPDYEED